MNWKEIEEYTEQRVTDPQTGDHFTEMCGSVAYIERRDGNRVLVSHPKPGKREWDDPKWMTLAEFKSWASYKSAPGYWLECIPPRTASQRACDSEIYALTG